MVRVSRRFIVPFLSVMLLGVAPAPVNAATTITGAVVAIPVSPSGYESPGYRLAPNKAIYLATFGGGNSDALVTSTGGCAIKSGQLSCYGLAGTVGDGTNRNRPLAVPITLPGGALAMGINQAEIDNASFWTNGFRFDYSPLRFMCAEGTSGVYCWGKNGGQTVLSPSTVFSASPRIFSGTVLLDDNGAIHHWEPTDYSDPRSSYAMTKIADTTSGIYGNVRVDRINQLFPYRSSTQWGVGDQEFIVGGDFGVCLNTAEQCLGAPLRNAMHPDAAAAWPSIDEEPAMTGLSIWNGSLIESSASLDGRCLYNDDEALQVSCSTSSSYEWIEASDESGLWSMVTAFKPSQFSNTITLPAGSMSPVVGGKWEPFACAIHDDMGAVCATPDEGPEDYDEWMVDLDGDGFASIGREFSLDCGVGFSCSFTPTKLRPSGSIITAIGTLVRTPRSSAAISGTAQYPDGTPFTGDIIWRSSDGKLRSVSTIGADGSFTLAARSGMGSIQLLQSDYPGSLPALCLDGTATAGCVTDVSATIYVDSLSSASGLTITVPTFEGEMRKIDLRFGDGETPIAEAVVSAVDPGTECSTTIVELGRMATCASLGWGLRDGVDNLIKTASDGAVSIWLPTAMDSVLKVSASDEYGLTWSEEIISLGDDGASPEPYSFAGLIFAQPLGSMTVRQGSSGTVSALVSVDGIDPAYGLSAGIRPTLTVATTCSTERRTDATDEGGLVDFSLCPAGTQLWKVYATDGSFFPSAPFPITIDPALTGLRISGATLDTVFAGGTTTYTGRFTGSRVTFTPTKASWAGSARVTTPTCSRPSRGTRDCTMSVKVGSATITYTFTLRR